MGNKDSEKPKINNISFDQLNEIIKETIKNLKKAKKEQKQLKNLNEKIANLKNEISIFEENITDTKNKIERYNNSIFSFILKYFVKSLQNQINNLESKIKTNNSKIDGLKKDVDKSEKFIFKHNRKIVFNHKLPSDLENAYNDLIDEFNNLSKCNKIWDITSEEDSHYKSTGATRSITRVVVQLKANPSFPFCNMDNEGMLLKNKDGDDINIFPTFLMRTGSSTNIKQINLLEDLSHHFSRVRFSETEKVPSDAEIVDHTWAVVNRDGSPDKRVNYNPKIPIASYGEIELELPNSKAETYQFSNIDSARKYSDKLKSYLKILERSDTEMTLDENNEILIKIVSSKSRSKSTSKGNKPSSGNDNNDFAEQIKNKI